MTERWGLRRVVGDFLPFGTREPKTDWLYRGESSERVARVVNRTVMLDVLVATK